jgi:uncharacterized protein (DUF924 family)
MIRAETILEYWFGPLQGPTDFNVDKASIWWAAGEAIDREIRERFGDIWESAKAGQLTSWLGTPQSALALVIVLDQFSRNLGRGTPEAFANDGAALEACTQAIERGDDLKLRPIECGFLYMPLMHSESPKTAELSVATFERLSQRIRDTCPKDHPDFLPHAIEHAAIVQRFGRYPHRNAILKRPSSAEELTFLAAGGNDYGQQKP